MATPLLRVEELTKHFGGIHAVQGVSFEVPTGAIIGLIGPNGAGKTTTFNMIAGAMKPTSGKITMDGEDITGMQTDQLFDKGLIRTFQLSHEYARLTAAENLMVAGDNQIGENIFRNWISPKLVAQREQEVVQRTHETLEFLGISHVADELAGNLSGGQKKLLELGRTMMSDAKFILLDEPGAGINPTLMLKVAEMIKRLNDERGYTFCVIEHDMEMIASLCEHVIVMAEGQILMQGSMQEVRDDARVIDAYFGGEVV